MAIGSSIELIWHFAGYLHLTQDYVASRVRLDEIVHNYQQSDYRFSADEHLAWSAGPSDMPSLAIRVKFSPGSENLGHVKWADLSEHHPLIVTAPNVAGNGDALPHFASGGGDALSVGKSHIVHYINENPGTVDPPPQEPQPTRAPIYEIKYVESGDDTIANLSQTNIASDRDYYSDGPTELDVLPHMASDQPVADMIAMAQEHNPTTMLPAGESVEFWTSAVVDRHESLATGDAEVEPIAAGRYVNGELIPVEESAEPMEADEHQAPVPPVRQEGSVDPAQIAATGGNELVNAGTIIDANEAPATLVVGGDYYETNAIIQTNILQNNDVVMQAGGAIPVLESAQNALDNVANFVVEELLKEQGHHKGSVKDLRVDIDYVDGDVMDVKSLTQSNYFDDGDVTVQTSFDSYSEIHTGESTQANVARFADWGKHYDVIIVVGDYHSANIISQTNVVLDNDLVGISAGAGDGPSIFNGQNALDNEGTIVKYGAKTFGNTNHRLDSLLDDLKDRDDLDRDAWSDFYGASSGSLNVLFVTGNYYDLNVVSQINVLADADLVVQTGSDGVQWISSGGNSASNHASIVNAGGVHNQYLGGDAYEDSILLQANLMSDSSETIATDPSALVSELVAFMDHSPDATDSESIAWTKDTFGHHDTFGHVMT